MGSHDTLRRGAWFSDSHESEYGKGFKVKNIHGWGASRSLVAEANAAASRHRDVYEFGVYTGGTMRGLARRLQNFGHLYGFDSFQGLPPETKGVELEGRHWRPGAFSAADALGSYHLPQLLAGLQKKIGYPNLTFVPGFYNESLTEALFHRHPFQPALLVDVDVDLYSSSMQCLTWMLDHALIVPGTYIRYDDFRRPQQRFGEGRAHREITRRYRITWRNLGVTGLNSREWQVLAIGSAEYHNPVWL